MWFRYSATHSDFLLSSNFLLLFSQALLQSHDVVAHEIYSEEVQPSPTPSPLPHAVNGGGSGADDRSNDGGGLPDEIPTHNGGEIAEVTRVRLVQFMKNTDEPLVNLGFRDLILISEDKEWAVTFKLAKFHIEQQLLLYLLYLNSRSEISGKSPFLLQILWSY